MANPKMKPCPRCDNREGLAVYIYESGWRHVECVECDYLGPGEGSIRQAIKSHNGERDERRKEYAALTTPEPAR